jgi:hypothetical protein
VALLLHDHHLVQVFPYDPKALEDLVGLQVQDIQQDQSSLVFQQHLALLVYLEDPYFLVYLMDLMDQEDLESPDLLMGL